MKALQLENESERRPYTGVQIFTQVFGIKLGYVCGLGNSVGPIGSSSSMSHVDLTWKLEEIRLEIEKMRARRMVYNEVAFRQT